MYSSTVIDLGTGWRNAYKIRAGEPEKISQEIMGR
jgi:hypothetical protein